ncbi:unnamed protein product, partial [Pylaiella littoralis]
EDSQDEEEQDLDILAPVAATLNEYSEQDAAVEVRDDAVENLRAGPRDVALV